MNDPDIFLPLNSRSLHFRWRRASHDLSCDGRFLTYTRAYLGNSSTTKTPLWRLMDDFVVDTPRDSRVQYYARRFRYSFALAGIVHFSELPRFVPYLAPALLAYALIMVYRGAPFAWRRTQTRVLTEYGDEIVVIPHLPKLDVTRQRFETYLRDSIKSAKDLKLE